MFWLSSTLYLNLYQNPQSLYNVKSKVLEYRAEIESHCPNSFGANYLTAVTNPGPVEHNSVQDFVCLASMQPIQIQFYLSHAPNTTGVGRQH
jgi:hypothetical protein